MTTAHLIALVDTGSAVIAEAIIASEPAESITHERRQFPVQMLSREGKDYADARQKILEELAGHYLSWLAPYLNYEDRLTVKCIRDERKKQ